MKHVLFVCVTIRPAAKWQRPSSQPSGLTPQAVQVIRELGIDIIEASAQLPSKPTVLW